MKYLALTLGPIYETFCNVRHTREVWGASFLFSYIAKRIIEKLCQNGGTGVNAHYFIQPNISIPKLFGEISGVGLFPDRIIVDAAILKGREFETIKQEVIAEMATIIGDSNNFLKDYLRIDYGHYEVSEGQNPIKVIAAYLDAAELQPHFVSQYEENPLKPFFKEINKPNGFLKGHYDEKDSNLQIRFESLVEITTRELRGEEESEAWSDYVKLINKHLWDNNNRKDLDKNDNKKDSDIDFVEALQKQNGDRFKTYHKYICVVKADGDGIGKRLTGFIGEDKVSQIQTLSTGLLKWGLDVKDTIRQYGGVPIYVGGDDLLFFAPVCNEYSKIPTEVGFEIKNILELLKKIKTDFESEFTKEAGFNPSLSFGLLISYYKFPLSEAIEKSESLLGTVKDESNKAQGEKGGKLALSLLKHSGAVFDLELKLEETNDLNTSFQAIFTQMGAIDDKPFLNGVNYKIRENQSLIERICADTTRLESLFKNIFEENQNEPKAKDKYLHELRSLIPISFGNDFYKAKTNIKNGIKESTELATKEIFSTVRFAKFLRGLEDLKD